MTRRRMIQVLSPWQTRQRRAISREIGEGVELYNNGDDSNRSYVEIAVAESFKYSVAFSREQTLPYHVADPACEEWLLDISIHTLLDGIPADSALDSS